MKSGAERLNLVLPILGLGLVCQHCWALSLGPAIFMVQHVKPGQSLNVKEKSGVVYTITNPDEKERTFNLACMKPVEGGVLNWEAGYDEIPDPSWCKLEKEEFDIGPKSKTEVGLTITIPDKPEYYNCKWVLAVVLQAGKAKGIGVGLAVAARVQIETARSEDAASGGAVSIAPIPSVISIEGKPGSAFERSVMLKNNTAQALECVTQRLEDNYTTGESRYPRFTTAGWRPMEKESWLKEKDAKLSLKPGQKYEFKLKGAIPESAKPGDKYEELVFVSESAVVSPEPGKVGPEKRPAKTFVRVQYQVMEEKK